MIINIKIYVVGEVDKQKFFSLNEDDINNIIPAECELKDKFIKMHKMFKRFPEFSSLDKENIEMRLPLQNNL